MQQIICKIIALLLFSFLSDQLSLKKTKQRQKINKHSKILPRKHSNHRIINGIKADISDYPFIASCQYNDDHMCGGSVISDTVILTAGHCCLDIGGDGGPLAVKYMSVSVGSSKWKEGKKFNVSKCIVHESFDANESINDIALIILKSNITNSDNVKLVDLANQPVNDNIKPVSATVIGWGYTSDSKGFMVEEPPDDLLMVDIYSIPLRECRNFWDGLLESHLCFTSPDRRGSCIGDSGGPLVVWKNFKFIQIGLVSYGYDCNSTYPEVYTRIDAFYPWIKNQMSKERKKKKKQRNY